MAEHEVKTKSPETSQMAIVGSEDVVCLFGAAGIEPVRITDASEADAALYRLAREGKKIIFLSEDLYQAIPDVLAKYADKAYPILLPLPLDQDANGVGLERIRKSVERAIGISLF